MIIDNVSANQTFCTRKSRNNKIHFKNPPSAPKMMDGDGSTSLENESVDTFVKLLILDFFLVPSFCRRRIILAHSSTHIHPTKRWSSSLSPKHLISKFHR
ncbi:hypothetical protein E6O75_ATG03707 [Venturia nashicola]|uniref:Uncharacterized protein n=1 Tax=Venturia nashicola TaxID=86259 RepID=A0A4Z1PSQ9_9PEZI|nr:hypothetical protein E6O75_ATG03707 [Venturia nashicola]